MPKDIMRTTFEQYKKVISETMLQAAIKINIPINIQGLGIASIEGSFIAGVPVDSCADVNSSAFIYFNVPNLGECSKLLPPDFYVVEITRTPLRGRFTGSNGKSILLNKITIESIPPKSRFPHIVELRIGGGVANICIPYSEEDRTIVWIKLRDDDPDTCEPL